MTYTTLAETVGNRAVRLVRSGRFLMLALIASFTSMALQPAQAQSADTWKSVAIIGGSTAVGAYVGHKVAGPTGAFVGAGVGATVGYKIDQKRRANEYYNQYAYGDQGYYGDNGGYYGDGGYGGQYDGGGYPYPSGYRSNNYQPSCNRCGHR